ncbi:MAG TPA: hypothetical protein PK784_01145 [Tenuifilaceae bacterium]|nr:hypothetical protein [Tenuifilaceae bacterium]
MKTEISNELKSHFLRLYQMAITDDNFSPLELKMLYKFAEERDVPKEELDKILLTANYQLVIPDTIERRIEYLYDLARMVWADGIIDEDERNTLKKYCRKFEFLDENIEELTQFLLDSAEKGMSKYEILNQLNS